TITNTNLGVLSYIDSASEGAAFIARTKCLVNISRMEQVNGTNNSFFGFSVNSNQLTTDIDLISGTSFFSQMVGAAATNFTGTSYWSIILEPGDILRCHDGSNNTTNLQPSS